MAGLLDGYGIDLDEVEAPSYDVPDDIYEFEVSDFYLQEGTDNWPDRSWLVIQYSLGDKGKSKSEWFELPEDASNPTDSELLKLGFYKNRLRDLGIEDSDMNGVGPDDLIGKRGTLQVFTKTDKRGTYQNIKNVRLAEEQPEQEAEAPKGRRSTPAKAAPKATTKRAAEPEEQPEDEPDEGEAEETEELVKPAVRRTQAASTQKARAAGVKANPFR